MVGQSVLSSSWLLCEIYLLHRYYLFLCFLAAALSSCWVDGYSVVVCCCCFFVAFFVCVCFVFLVWPLDPVVRAISHMDCCTLK